jgi:hypothetical protein
MYQFLDRVFTWSMTQSDKQQKKRRFYALKKTIFLHKKSSG